MKRLAWSALLALPAFACNKAEDPAAGKKPALVALPPVSVMTAAVEVRNMPRLLTLTGNVVAEKASEVAANVAGRIVSTPIERGQAVKAGQILATVDSKNAGFSVAASKAQYSLAETQAAQAREDCSRSETLFKQGAIAQAEYDRQMTQCKAQELSANAARAQAGLAAGLASDSIIRAPFDGTVGERYVHVGEYVQPASRVASVYVYDPVRITVSVPEAAIALVRDGQSLAIRVAAFPERTFPSTVVYLSPALRPATRDLIIEARAANADGALRPGMFATVELETGEAPLPTVPVDAVVTDGTSRRIFLVRDDRAFEMVVQTGVTKDGRTALHEPLDGTARVIVKPPPGLRDGTSVTEGAPAAAKPSASEKRPL